MDLFMSEYEQVISQIAVFIIVEVVVASFKCFIKQVIVFLVFLINQVYLQESKQ